MRNVDKGVQGGDEMRRYGSMKQKLSDGRVELKMGVGERVGRVGDEAGVGYRVHGRKMPRASGGRV